MKMLHSKTLVLCLTMSLFLLTACSGAPKVPEVVKENSVIIDKEGTISFHITDRFDKDYYDLDGLKVMAQEEINAYHAAKGDDASNVVLEKVEMVEGTDNLVAVSYKFANQDAYKSFTGNDFFYGTVGEAIAAGYDFSEMNQILYGAATEKSMVSSELANGSMNKKHVILLEESMRIYCPIKVAYTSENAEVMEDGSVDSTGIFSSEYPVVIVLDK